MRHQKNRFSDPMLSRFCTGVNRGEGREQGPDPVAAEIRTDRVDGKRVGVIGMSSESPATTGWTAEIEELRRRGLFRTMPKMEGLPGRTCWVDGNHVINFSSNNYLGLAGHPKVIQAIVDAVQRYGAGSTASRLIAGNCEAHRELEDFIARWKGTEAALAFGSGYQANIGVLSSLTASPDLIVSDELNHASIIDGCRLSRAEVKVYSHLDLNRAEDALKADGFRRKLLVTESVFSMDGDRAPLKELRELCTRRGALLMVDEAHAAGVHGSKGQGLAEELGITPDVQMGTLGKAAGTSGAYVAGRSDLIDLLINKARSLIYTTALPPSVMGGASEALRITASEEGDVRRARLRKNAALFHGLLHSHLRRRPEASHIVPVVIGQSTRTMKISAECLGRGVFAHGIRYPTVPEGTARLRFTLMSDHTDADLRRAAQVLEESLEAVPEES
ncbi:MAG: 8-amino-7-oxononanoate synthase [Desulfomonilaceae bacterium]|nr:8-amino-7-oxononanoate synthase [Desulfomonilaceae bacterium]